MVWLYSREDNTSPRTMPNVTVFFMKVTHGNFIKLSPSGQDKSHGQQVGLKLDEETVSGASSGYHTSLACRNTAGIIIIMIIANS